LDSVVDGGVGVGPDGIEAGVAEQVGDLDGPITRIWLLPAHRPARLCVDPRCLGPVQTTHGIWLRAPELSTQDTRPARRTPRH
jgi:hypothetical protein